MRRLPFALYDAFCESPFGGSQAAIVSDAADIDATTMARLVGELGLPAIAFVSRAEGRFVEASFRSTVMELPMCGHGTVALMTRMAELEVLDLDGSAPVEVGLRLPRSEACVTVSRRDDGRPVVMLAVRPPAFRRDDVDRERLAALLGIGANGFSTDLPMETAAADFVHLVVPMEDLGAMRAVAPDFEGLVAFCHDLGVETVALFSLEVEDPLSTLHVRDFCPAVGVAESAAAGTTNAALAAYLLRHRIVAADLSGKAAVRAEQGIEIGRASTILTRAQLEGEKIVRLEVGGVATRVLEGSLTVCLHTDT